MASWTNLPLDINKKIVKELDLLARFRLKISSTSNRDLVNSVPLTIKNARIGIGEERCLLMVHTGIGEFVKLDLELIKGKVVIKRSINSYNISKAKCIQTDLVNALTVLIYSMKSLLTSPTNNILLIVLEVEILKPLHFTTMMRLSGLLDVFGVQLRVQRLVFASEKELKPIWAIGRYCKEEDLKETSQLTLYTNPESAEPGAVHDTYMMKFLHGAPMRHSKVFFYCINYNTIPMMLQQKINEHPQVYIVYRCRFLKPKEMFDMVQAETISLADNIFVKRVIEGSVVYRHTLTPCGYSMTVIHESMEHKIPTETCGLGELCWKCKSPFEFCYFYDLARRVINEKNWLTVFDNDSEEEMKKFAELMEGKTSRSDAYGRNRKSQDSDATEGRPDEKEEVVDFESESKSESESPSDVSDASSLPFFVTWTLITILITLIFSFFFPQFLVPLGIQI